MTLLSDADLIDAMVSGDLAIEPKQTGLIGPASIDLVLGTEFRLFTRALGESTQIDPSREQPDLTYVLSREVGEAVVLAPQQFVLASSRERVTLGADLAARLEGKSSLGRLGLMVHATAGFIDPGFSGNITLEMSNISPWPIRLVPGMRIAQLSVFRLSSPAMVPYGLRRGSRYQDQEGPTASRSWREWRLW